MTEQLALEMQPVYLGPETSPNPMVRLHGVGPVGATCGTCARIVYWGNSRPIPKCSKRGDLTHGAATDQRKRWRACGLWQAVQEEADGHRIAG